MWVTLSTVVIVVVLPVGAAISVAGRRTVHEALSPLATASKFD